MSNGNSSVQRLISYYPILRLYILVQFLIDKIDSKDITEVKEEDLAKLWSIERIWFAGKCNFCMLI